MRRFAGFLTAALVFAVILGGFSRVEGRDDLKGKEALKYGCNVCDNKAYEPTKNRALVYIHIAGLNGGRAHRVKLFESGSASGFVFRETPKSRARICTAWHVVRILDDWETGLLAVYLYDMREPVSVRVARYSPSADIAVLDFADSNYKFNGLPLDLGDDADLEEGDAVVAMGAPDSHPFMRSSGEFLGYYGTDDGMSRLWHNAATMGGSSGGPVVDKTGRVVGINVAIFTKESEFYPGSVAASVSDLRMILEEERRREKEQDEDE